MLDCEFVEASVIYYNQINRIDQLDDAEENVKFLVKNNVNLVTIRKSPNVLAMSLREYCSKWYAPSYLMDK